MDTTGINPHYTGAMNEILDIGLAAEYLKVSKNRLYQWTARKAIPYRKIGGTTVFMKYELFDLVDSGKLATLFAFKGKADE